MSIFEEYISDFVIHMKHKLLVHKNKGGFERLATKDLLGLLRAEVEELQTALDDGDHVESVKECADIANYAMFIATKIQNRKDV